MAETPQHYRGHRKCLTDNFCLYLLKQFKKGSANSHIFIYFSTFLLYYNTKRVIYFFILSGMIPMGRVSPQVQKMAGQ